MKHLRQSDWLIEHWPLFAIALIVCITGWTFVSSKSSLVDNGLTRSLTFTTGPEYEQEDIFNRSILVNRIISKVKCGELKPDNQRSCEVYVSPENHEYFVKEHNSVHLPFMKRAPNGSIKLSVKDEGGIASSFVYEVSVDELRGLEGFHSYIDGYKVNQTITGVAVDPATQSCDELAGKLKLTLRRVSDSAMASAFMTRYQAELQRKIEADASIMTYAQK